MNEFGLLLRSVCTFGENLFSFVTISIHISTNDNNFQPEGERSRSQTKHVPTHVKTLD